MAGNTTYPGCYARNLLIFFDTLVYTEPHVFPENGQKSGITKPDKPENSHTGPGSFTIFPNPAMSYFVVEYSLSNVHVNSLELIISELSGKLVQRITLPENTGHLIIGTQELKPGIYLCKFVMPEGTNHTIKLTVIK